MSGNFITFVKIGIWILFLYQHHAKMYANVPVILTITVQRIFIGNCASNCDLLFIECECELFSILISLTVTCNFTNLNLIFFKSKFLLLNYSLHFFTDA